MEPLIVKSRHLQGTDVVFPKIALDGSNGEKSNICLLS